MEGSLSNCLFETAHNASNSTDVDAHAFKFGLVQYDTFYNDRIQQEWFLMCYDANKSYQ